MGMLLAYELEKGTERELKDLAAALGHQVIRKENWAVRCWFSVVWTVRRWIFCWRG